MAILREQFPGNVMRRYYKYDPSNPLDQKMAADLIRDYPHIYKIVPLQEAKRDIRDNPLAQKEIIALKKEALYEPL